MSSLLELLIDPRRDALEASVRDHYRKLHEIPELCFEEHETAAYLVAALRALGLEPRTGLAGTGVVVELPGAGEGPTVLLRADMDGLPVAEDPAHTLRSLTEGRMHACGHDGHMAIALGAAEAVTRGLGDARKLPGRLLVLFQPAEEGGGGAQRLVESGLLDELGVDHVLGLHLWSFLPLGEAIIPDRTVMASSDEFHIRLRGSGGHGALPHTTEDVVLAASQLVVALQSIVARNIDPVRPAVLTVGRLRAGDAPNVIPQEAELYGTFRAGDAEVRSRILERIGQVADATARAHGVEIEVDFGMGYPPTVNDPAVAGSFRASAAAVLGEAKVHAGPPAMASEDFAFYLRARPGAFCLLGMRDEESGAVHAHHSPHFKIAEPVLPLGLEILLRGALGLMER